MKMKKMKRVLIFFLLVAFVVALGACGTKEAGNPTESGSPVESGSPSEGGASALNNKSKSPDDTITIFEGEFSEMWVIHEMVKLLVEEHTDAKVVIKDQMAPANSYNEIIRGNADLMNSYVGTLLTTFLHMDAADCPEGQDLYDFVNEKGAEKGVRLLDTLGLNNTYIMAVTEETAEEYNLSKTSDLVPIAGELVFGAEHDFFTEEGSAKYAPLCEFYGLAFKDSRQMDMAMKYPAIEKGNIDVTVAYATDGLNIKYGLKLLEDDLNYFPDYKGAILVRSDLFDRLKDVAPNLEEVLNMLGGIFTNESMTELTYAIDVDKKDVHEVCVEYLSNLGLITETA